MREILFRRLRCEPPDMAYWGIDKGCQSILLLIVIVVNGSNDEYWRAFEMPTTGDAFDACRR